MDREEFARTFVPYTCDLYAWFLQRVDPASARDLVQETFLAAFKDRDSYEHRGAPKAWLFTIAKNQMIKKGREENAERRSSRRTQGLDDAIECSDARALGLATLLEHREQERRLPVLILYLMRPLNPSQREILRRLVGEADFARPSERTPIKEIANAMGMTEDAIHMALYRARRAMEARLRAYHPLQPRQRQALQEAHDMAVDRRGGASPEYLATRNSCPVDAVRALLELAKTELGLCCDDTINPGATS